MLMLVDRLQPADIEGPVRIGGPDPSPVRQTPLVAPLNQLEPLLQKYGAGAILRPSTYPHGTTGATGSPATKNDAVPTVNLQTERYNMIVRMMQSGVTPQLRLELRTASPDFRLVDARAAVLAAAVLVALAVQAQAEARRRDQATDANPTSGRVVDAPSLR